MKNKLFKMGIFIIVLIIVFSLFGCSNKEIDEKNNTEDDEIVVGFSLGTLMEDRWIRDRDIFMSKASSEGIKVIVKNANKDSELQYTQVTQMLEQGIDVLVIAPNDSVNEIRCVQAAKEKNIPVISYDRLVYNSDVDAYISFDNTSVGMIMANHLVENVPKGGYMIISGSQNDSNSEMIYEGAMSVLKPYIEKGDIEILAETWVNGWIRESAYEFLSEELKKDNTRKELKAIICGNDSLAWGAIDALAEQRIAEQVQVTGQDADLVACQRVVTGKQALTVYKPIKNLVEKTVEICLALINGEVFISDGTIDNGGYKVPYIYIDVEAVTMDTIEETVIKDGFHQYEDIYQKE